MGPLFALLFFIPIASVIGLVVFIVSYQFLPSAGAIRMAIAMPIAGAIGCAAGGIALAPFFPQKLISTAQVMTFLGGACTGGLLLATGVGCVIWRLYRN